MPECEFKPICEEVWGTVPGCEKSEGCPNRELGESIREKVLEEVEEALKTADERFYDFAYTQSVWNPETQSEGPPPLAIKVKDIVNILHNLREGGD